MFLGCLSCIFNYKKRPDEEQEIEAIYYERAKFLPVYLALFIFQSLIESIITFSSYHKIYASVPKSKFPSYHKKTKTTLIKINMKLIVLFCI